MTMFCFLKKETFDFQPKFFFEYFNATDDFLQQCVYDNIFFTKTRANVLLLFHDKMEIV